MEEATKEMVVAEPGMSRDVIYIRKKERGLLKINDIFGPPASVRNEVFRAFGDACTDGSVPDDNFYTWIDKWVDSQMNSKGYVRIRNNQAFARHADGTWEKEYKLVST